MRPCVFAFATVLCVCLPLTAQHSLKVSPETVRWGYFAADTKPVITVKPGETLTMDTIVGIPEMLVRLGAPVDGHAVKEMIEYLISERGLSRDDAYFLVSAAANLCVTQVVDGVKGVHAMLAKSIVAR